MEFIIHHVSNIITTDNYAPSKNFEPIEKWYEAHNYFEVTYMNCFHHVYRLLLCFDISSLVINSFLSSSFNNKVI